MKNSKRILSIILVILMALSFVACNSGSESSESSGVISEASSNDATSTEESVDNSSTAESEESTENSDSSTLSEETSQSEESAVQSEESSKEEEKSEEKSEESSEAASSDSGDTSTLNPYEGTDIKPVEGKVIAFTFDDGPSYTDSTKKILDKLEELGMNATFFVVGNRVSAGTAPLIKRMVELGCDIGNHSYDHPNFNSMTVAQVNKQIADTNARLEKYVGVKATLIRPPYGNIMESHMVALNTPIICWDIDSLDWKFYSENKKTHSKEQISQMIYKHTLDVMEEFPNRKIVLMHDIYDTTADAFCMLADKLVADGYTLVSISELLGTEKLMCTTIKYGFKW